MSVIGAMGAVERHLFVLAPNNSGSTFLTKALEQSPGAWALPREGQHVEGFVGPSTRSTGAGLLWAESAESIAHFADPAVYDWEKTRRAWHFKATSHQPGAKVLVVSSPPFLLLAEDLAQHFPDARFILLHRNPWATSEGIIRGTRPDPGESETDLARRAARHVIFALGRQLTNRQLLRDRATSFSYEEMCAQPTAIGAAIAALVPELGGVELDRRVAVKGNYDEALRDMNADQIARLAPAVRGVLNSEFAAHRDLLLELGYGAAS
jgi:Sulfotransferase family